MHEFIVLCMEIERETNPAEYERLIAWNKELRKKRLQKERIEKLKKKCENNL